MYLIAISRNVASICDRKIRITKYDILNSINDPISNDKTNDQ